MILSDKVKPILSVWLIALGMILALLLTALALWPDFEAALFDTTHSGGEALNTLRCPLLITPADDAVLRLKLSNPLAQPVNFLARANIAKGFLTLMRQEKAQAIMLPGESVEFTWPINPEDAVYGRMILARVRVLRTNTLPERQKACGILVLPVPVVKGAHVVGALLAAILLCLGLGAALWLRQERPLTARQRERARIVGLLAFLLLLTMVISLLGWWGGGIIIIMIIILFLTAVMERFGWQK